MTRCVGKLSIGHFLNYLIRFSDVEPPKIDCPKNVTIDSENKLYYATVSWNEPSSSGFRKTSRISLE